MALVSLDVLTSTTSPLLRLVAPTGVDNTPAAALFRDTGFTCEATLPGLRETPAGRGDCQLWVLHRNDAAVDAVRAALGWAAAPSTGTG